MKRTLVLVALLAGAVVATVALRPAAREADCCDPPAQGIVLAPWIAHLQSVDDAIAAHDVERANRAWRDAWVAALATRRWEVLVAVGDASLRIGELAEASGPARANARQAYHSALFRAYGEGSADGVLRTAEAMAAMGDGELVETALRLAHRLAAASRDPEVRARIERDIARIAGRMTTFASSNLKPSSNEMTQ